MKPSASSPHRVSREDDDRSERRGPTKRKAKPRSNRPLANDFVSSGGRRRILARQGLATFALGALGLTAALVMKAFAPYLWAYAAYVAIGCLFQWMILRRVFRTVARTLCMGVVDVCF